MNPRKNDFERAVSLLHRDGYTCVLCDRDRVLTSRFGVAAAQLITQKKFGYMVALQDNHIVPVPLTEVAGKLKTVPPDGELVKQARALGLSMGD